MMPSSKNEEAVSSSRMADHQDVPSCHPAHGSDYTESTLPRLPTKGDGQTGHGTSPNQCASIPIDQPLSRPSTGLASSTITPAPRPRGYLKGSVCIDVPTAQVSSCSTHTMGAVSNMSYSPEESDQDIPSGRESGENSHAARSEESDDEASAALLPSSSCEKGASPRDDAEECSFSKRKNFLERNRKAAQKCRLRKKAWFASLEAKVKYLESVNESLQNTVISFRSKIVRLQSQLDDLQQQLQQQQQSQQQRVHRPIDVCSDTATHHAISHGMHTTGSHDGIHTNEYPTLHEYPAHSPRASPSSFYAPFPSVVHTSEPLLPSRVAPYCPLKRGYHPVPPKMAPDSRVPHRYTPTSSSSGPSYAQSHLPPPYMPSRGPI